MQSQERNNTLELKLSQFSGPLDLLLLLIRNKKVEIRDIDLIEITTQYTKFIEYSIHDVEVEKLGEYLYLATQLVHLKIKSMFAALNDESALVDLAAEKEALIQKLIEREKYYQSIPFLEEQFQARQQYVDKVSEDLESLKPKKPIIEEQKVENLDSYKLKDLLETMVQDNIIDDFLKQNALFRREVELKKISIKKIQLDLVDFLKRSEYENKINLFEAFKLIYPEYISQEYFACFLLAILSLMRLSYLKMEISDNTYWIVFNKKQLKDFSLDLNSMEE